MINNRLHYISVVYKKNIGWIRLDSILSKLNYITVHWIRLDNSKLNFIIVDYKL